MHDFAAWAHHYGPIFAGICIALIPSVINAMMPYRRTEGVRKVLGTIFEMLTILTRSDSPGTMKLPFTVSPPPGARRALVAARLPFKTYGDEPAAGAVAAPLTPPPSAAVLVAFAILACASCGPRGAAIGHDVGRCELGALPQQSETAIADVTAVLFAGGEWQTQLGGLAGQLGAQAVDCIVQAVVHNLTARAARHGQVAPDYQGAIQRGNDWLHRAGK